MSAATPDPLRTLELTVKGMDCTECVQHVQRALASLPGVEQAQVFLASEKAVVRYDPTLVDLPAFAQAVLAAGYLLPRNDPQTETSSPSRRPGSVMRPLLPLFALVFGMVLLARRPRVGSAGEDAAS